MILKHATDYDKKLAKELYLSAFPFKERKPWFLIEKWVKKGRYDLLVAKDENGFAGLLITVPYKDMVLFDYLAVNPGQRSKGYGSEILALAEKHYEGMRLMLVAEACDKDVELVDMRVKRLEFYDRNGWNKTKYLSVATSGVFHILVKGDITPDEYIKVNNYALGNFLFKISKMHVKQLDEEITK